MNGQLTRTDVYQIITDRILDQLEQGCVPWQKPWRSVGGVAPTNLHSGRPYRGINVFLLSVAPFSSPYWLTFRQAKERGGHVKAGSKGYPVVYWNWREVTEETTGNEEPKTKLVPFLRYYTVFNVEQTEGVAYPKPETLDNNNNSIEACEQIVANMPHRPVIRHQGDAAYYQPTADRVTMPPMGLFRSSEEYYSTLFHELTHSTGHESRLARPTLTELCPFGSTNYSKEELVAEMGAAFLCGQTGIENRTIDNSAAYIKNWLSKLRNDRKMVVCAAAQAQKAADLILGRTHEKDEQES